MYVARRLLLHAASLAILLPISALGEQWPSTPHDSSAPRPVTTSKKISPRRLPPVMEPPPPKAPATGGQVRLASHQEASAPSPDEVPSITLTDLEQIALESNPTLFQASLAVRAAEGDYVQAGLYPNTIVGATTDDLTKEGSGPTGAFLVQRFVTMGKLGIARAATSRAVQEAQFALAAQQWRVLNDVRAAYYRVLIAQKMMALNNELVRIGEEGASVAEKLRAASEVSEADVLQARIEADKAKLGLIRAQNQRLGHWRNLAAVAGVPTMPLHLLFDEIEETLPSFEWDDVLATVLSQSPELAQAQSALDRALFEFQLQCAERWPNFEVGTAIKYDHNFEATVVDLEVGWELPIFDRNQGNVRRAQADLVAAQQELDRIALDLQTRLASAYADFASAQQEVKLYKGSILPNAESSLRMMRTGYREGEFGYLELLTAQRTFFNVSLTYLDSLNEFWARTVDLEGMLLSGGLQRAE